MGKLCVYCQHNYLCGGRGGGEFHLDYITFSYIKRKKKTLQKNLPQASFPYLPSFSAPFLLVPFQHGLHEWPSRRPPLHDNDSSRL